MVANNYSLVEVEPSLEKWLREEGLLARFKRNVHVIGKQLQVDSLEGAFDWRISYEGYEFWRKVYESSKKA